ncbi:MAG: hypothetical protein ISQ86_13775, partial [Alphaproteobacteria bacterium]|nr:hypothetical protein [Alphaproteobacteria bacterium]
KTCDLVKGAAIALILLAPTAAFAADAAKEIATARLHAGLAAKATDLAGVQMHLHHAVNCLVGSNGQGYDVKQMNPCSADGTGAIPDSDPAKRPALEAAAATARGGIAATDLAVAQKAANDTAAALK